jgi:dTDP-4-amino-4,6-dideoxygalactose transaminase
MPSFNFSSAATAVALTGATPVFIDVDVKTKNMTSNGVAEALTDRTRAVIVLHYAGVLAPVEDIRHLTDSIGAYVIEDGAHGLGVRTKQGTLGSFGTFATYSFHETKNVQCGEGGSLQINDPEFLERAEILREKGTNRQRFFRGQVDKYTWVDQGSSWLLAEPLSALILGQLQVLSEIQQSRLDAFERYVDALEGWCAAHGFEVDTMPPDQEGAAHLFALIAPDLKTRSEFIQHLKDQGVTAAFHYQPLDSSPAGRLLGRAEACPVSAELGDRLVRLPLFTDISESEIDQVLSAVCAFKAS